MSDGFGMCSICKDRYTMQNIEVDDDTSVYMCSECVEKARENFIWLCMTCGKSYINPKELVISKIKDLELKKAYMLCEDMLTVQGIDVCIACSPERMLDYAEMNETAMEC